MRRLVAVALLLGMASPAAADIRTSAAQQSALAARPESLRAQARPNAPGSEENPYFLPSVILMGGGGLVTLYGLTHDTGVSCSTNSNLTSVSCGTTKSKATIFTGLGIVGVGAYLFAKGRQRASSPEILIGRETVGVRHRLVW